MDLKALKRASKQVLERNEVLTKLLKDHRKRDKERVRAVQAAPAVCEGRMAMAGGGREAQEGAGTRGRARERAIHTGSREGSEEGSEEMGSALQAAMPLEESDALRLRQAQVSMYRRRSRAGEMERAREREVPVCCQRWRARSRRKSSARRGGAVSDAGLRSLRL